MAKAKLTAMTQKWIDDGKAESQHAVLSEIPNDIITDKSPKIKQTFYMSQNVVKMLALHRAETREPMSQTVEKLVMEYIGKR